MGHSLPPMCSGILELILRFLTAILLMPALGFQATAWAEVAAWTGALALNWIAYARIMSQTARRA